MSTTDGRKAGRKLILGGIAKRKLVNKLELFCCCAWFEVQQKYFVCRGWCRVLLVRARLGLDLTTLLRFGFLILQISSYI